MDPRRSAVLPDPARVGGPAWLAATGGRLTRRQQAGMLAASGRVQARWVVEHLRARAPLAVDVDEVLDLPETPLVAAAAEAAAVQGPALLGHARRTAVFARAGAADRAAALEDAIVVHTTIGVDPTVDGALGSCVQWGAMVDLVGLRERHLPHALVRAVVDRHPRTGFPRVLRRAVRAEARAVPDGRFALLRTTGFPLVVSAARVPSRP